MSMAITRAVSPQIGRCELTFRDREPIDIALARKQHRRYEECLIALGCSVQRLAEQPELPDSVFVEDTAIVLDELAIIARPGAESRRQEVFSVAQVLSRYRSLARVEAPGILDGGDVLLIERSLFVGLSRRSNEAAVQQLRQFLCGHGYTVIGIPVKNCLHLKSAATQVAEDTLLLNRHWVDADVFGTLRVIEVDPSEPGAANALRIAGSVVFPSHYPATRQRLEALRLDVRAVDASELAKAEGGVTCCSLIFSP